MSNELSKTTSSQQNAVQVFMNKAGATGDGPTVDPIMTLDNKDSSPSIGHWIYGQSRDELEHPFDGLAMRESLFVGHVCWKEGKIVDEISAPMLDDAAVLALPNVEDLPHHGPYTRARDGWSAQMGGLVRLVDEGVQVRWRTSLNVGGSQCLNRLSPMLTKGAAEHPNADPLLRFTVGSYWNKTADKTTYTPQIIVVKWVARAGTPSAADLLA